MRQQGYPGGSRACRAAGSQLNTQASPDPPAPDPAAPIPFPTAADQKKWDEEEAATIIRQQTEAADADKKKFDEEEAHFCIVENYSVPEQPERYVNEGVDAFNRSIGHRSRYYMQK